MLSTISLSSVVRVFEEEQKGRKEYTEELAFVSREDGLGLEGAVIRPRGIATRPVAVVWIHGNTSRYYDAPYIQIGRELAALGYTFITSNTHGHDVTLSALDVVEGAREQEACQERFERIPLDVKAWIDVAVDEGFKGVVLVGHSFGANKVLYYQAERQDSRVLGVVLASGDVKWKPSPDLLALAEQMEAEDRLDQALPQLDTPWYRMSARTFLSRARLARQAFDSDTVTPHIARITCPLLAFYGSQEEWCGTASDLDTVRSNAVSSPRVDTTIIEGADHVYWGKASVVAQLIGDWADELWEAEDTLAA